MASPGFASLESALRSVGEGADPATGPSADGVGSLALTDSSGVGDALDPRLSTAKGLVGSFGREWLRRREWAVAPLSWGSLKLPDRWKKGLDEGREESVPLLAEERFCERTRR